jgi:hypothetical protein
MNRAILGMRVQRKERGAPMSVGPEFSEVPHLRSLSGVKSW